MAARSQTDASNGGGQLIPQTPGPDPCSPCTFRVTKHKSTFKKVKDWDLQIKENTVIIGDSNLGRIETFLIPGIQIDSFPGAKFSHAETILAKIHGEREEVKEVILSLGINNRQQRPKETSIKQLTGAIRTAKKKFPNAQIYVPLINFSYNLSPKEKDNLHTLNTYMMHHTKYIPLLPDRDFKTESDHIHWTTETGANMLQHWMEHLNSQLP